ncbi:hypothetical protein BU24DRAFT_420821 [Aaosphaeria arxii CBS 175.79]|uniref:Uncharacterized protein n=1 Tax=Aaosphaeria arxii CBS 175.79 TaxID=1450172 RepID=A0A6A5XX78_9PLEO|nr:uncharacterized protein BU24DRAFT_420821 [Aaosphaeria arxii CBS 175.79]KAF2017772.1 hypothetical protein BU24DRAFT_420821 [Aaosphaeria arxii CBS 175.79]
MVLELLNIAAIPTAIGAAEAVHQQNVFDEEAESDERQAPFYLDVYCDAASKKRDEVHNAIVVLKDGKLRLWPKDPETNLPEAPDDDNDSPPPHPFQGFYLPYPTEDLPDRPIPAPRILGLVSTIPPDPSSSSPKSKSKGKGKRSSRAAKHKLNWIYADKNTRELKYGPRAVARDHFIGPWDWTEDDEQGLVLDGEESLVAVEEEKGGYGWAVYWDREDDRLKGFEVGKTKRVLRCSLERRLIEEEDDGIHVE